MYFTIFNYYLKPTAGVQWVPVRRVGHLPALLATVSDERREEEVEAGRRRGCHRREGGGQAGRGRRPAAVRQCLEHRRLLFADGRGPALSPQRQDRHPEGHGRSVPLDVSQAFVLVQSNVNDIVGWQSFLDAYSLICL